MKIGMSWNEEENLHHLDQVEAPGGINHYHYLEIGLFGNIYLHEQIFAVYQQVELSCTFFHCGG